MNVTVDTTKCDGHEKCVQAAPNVFKMNERFIAEVADSNGDHSGEGRPGGQDLSHQGHRRRG